MLARLINNLKLREDREQFNFVGDILNAPEKMETGKEKKRKVETEKYRVTPETVTQFS